MSDDRCGQLAAVTDLWFRTGMSLLAIADGLGLTDREHDSEDVWEWVIGAFAGTRLDVTRDHRSAPQASDVRVFLIEGGEYTPRLRASIVTRLFELGIGQVHHGRWRYQKGHDFEKVCVGTEERPAGPTGPTG